MDRAGPFKATNGQVCSRYEAAWWSVQRGVNLSTVYSVSCDAVHV